MDGPGLLDRVRSNAGHGTLVNVWATWCGPCRRELPMFRSLADNLRARGVAVLLISVDEPEAEPELVRMLRAEGFEPPFYLARRPLDAFKAAVHPGWPGMIPATFLFDASGRRRYFWGGPVYEHELVPIAEGLIAGRDIDGEARFDLAPGAQTGH
jgi:thiol-disulfide isomerase/thioredoxin